MVRKCGWRSELSSPPPSVLPPTPPARHTMAVSSSSSSSYQRKSSRWTFYDATQLTSVHNCIVRSNNMTSFITIPSCTVDRPLDHRCVTNGGQLNFLQQVGNVILFFFPTTFDFTLKLSRLWWNDVVYVFIYNSNLSRFLLWLISRHGRCTRNLLRRRPSSARSSIASTARKDAIGMGNCASSRYLCKLRKHSLYHVWISSRFGSPPPHSRAIMCVFVHK